MDRLFTHGIWQVKPGRGEEFVAAWTEFAQWSKQNAKGAGWVKLLRDSADPNRFITVGPWESVQAIEAWRAMDGWKTRVGKIRELLVSFQPANAELVWEAD